MSRPTANNSPTRLAALRADPLTADLRVEDLSQRDLLHLADLLYRMPESSTRAASLFLSVGMVSVYANGDIYPDGDHCRLVRGADLWARIHEAGVARTGEHPTSSLIVDMWREAQPVNHHSEGL
jgi:hypothetical protein